MMTDGERIKLIRKTLNLTQEAFGEPIGITKGHISDVEKNKKKLSMAAIELLKIRYAVNESWWEKGVGEILKEKIEPVVLIQSEKDSRLSQLAEKSLGYGLSKPYSVTGLIRQVSPEEEELLSCWESLDEGMRHTLIDVARALAKRSKD